MTLYASAGERVFGTRTVMRGHPPREVIEDYHHCTLRHDIFIGELPDFPACLGDWQQGQPPVTRHFYREAENAYLTTTETVAGEVVCSTATATVTKTTTFDLLGHGGGAAPEFGVPWYGESWWREYDHGDPDGCGTAGRHSVHYDLRFRGKDGGCTWGMDRLKGTNT